MKHQTEEHVAFATTPADIPCDMPRLASRHYPSQDEAVAAQDEQAADQREMHFKTTKTDRNRARRWLARARKKADSSGDAGVVQALEEAPRNRAAVPSRLQSSLRSVLRCPWVTSISSAASRRPSTSRTSSAAATRSVSFRPSVCHRLWTGTTIRKRHPWTGKLARRLCLPGSAAVSRLLSPLGSLARVVVRPFRDRQVAQRHAGGRHLRADVLRRCTLEVQRQPRSHDHQAACRDRNLKAQTRVGPLRNAVLLRLLKQGRSEGRLPEQHSMILEHTLDSSMFDAEMPVCPANGWEYMTAPSWAWRKVATVTNFK